MTSYLIYKIDSNQPWRLFYQDDAEQIVQTYSTESQAVKAGLEEFSEDKFVA